MQTSELKTKLQKSIDFLQTELNQVRTGRANPALIEDIVVEAYESKMSLKEVGSITLLDSQTLVVTPWDRGLANNVGKALRESDLHFNPIVDNGVIRVPIPSLTEERRKELAKYVSQKVEESKNSLRSIRQDAMKEIEKSFTDKEIGEDVKFSKKEEVEKIVKEYVEKADEIGESKKNDLLTI